MAQMRPAYEVRPYQVACLRALRAAFTGAVGFALFVLATGLGKTYVAMKFLDWLLRRVRDATDRRPRVLVLCHQKPILRQLRRSFAEYFGDRRSTGLLRAKSKRQDPPDVDILFATFQAMRSRRARFGREYFDIVIVDEGHHSMADSYAATIRYFRPSFRFAMTATPDRMDLRDIRNLFGPEVYSKPLATALAERLLPRVVYKYFLETHGRCASESLNGEKPSRKLLDQRFFRARSSPERDQKIAGTIVEEMSKLKEPRVLVFCQSIADCEAMTTYLVERGVKAAAVHYKIDDDEQEARLEALKTGKLEVLVARDVLNEGKDIPAINLVAIVRSTASRTIFEQQIGRGLRPGKDELVVLDFVANCDRIQYLAELVNSVRGVLLPPKQPGGGGYTVCGGDVTPGVLLVDDPEVPVEVRAGDIEFEVLYKDLVQVLEKASAWTLESGTAALVSLARRLGKNTLTSQDINRASVRGETPSQIWVRYNLAPQTGKLAEALAALGLEGGHLRNPPHAGSLREWTPEAGKEALVGLATALKKDTLTQDDVSLGCKAGRCPNVGWVRRNFTAGGEGGWNEALVALGLMPGSWTVEETKAALVALAASLGVQTLTSTQINDGCRAGKCPHTRTVAKFLTPNGGGISEALRAAGLVPRGWTVESGGASLRRLAARLGKRSLLIHDIVAGSKNGECPSYVWCLNHLCPDSRSISGLMGALGLEAE